MTKNEISNYRMAQMLNSSQTSVANWREGKNVPHKKTLISISELFGITLDELTGNSLPEAELKKGKKENPSPTNGQGLDKDTLEIIEMLSGMSAAEMVLVKERIRKIKESRE